MQIGGAGNRTTALPISRWRALPEPLLPQCGSGSENTMLGMPARDKIQ